MPKANGSDGKAPTHFETVPLEVVKEIAVEDVPADRIVAAPMKNVVRPAPKNLVMPVPTRAPAGKKR